MSPFLALLVGGLVLLALLLLIARRLAAIEQRLFALELGAAGLRVPQAPRAASPPPGASDGVVEALRAGNKLEAIRRYRLATGVGLQEAKDHVERLARGG